MIPRRITDDVSPWAVLGRQVCAWIVCLGCLCLFKPPVANSAERYADSLASDDKLFTNLDSPPAPVESTDQPWFLKHSSEGAFSRNMARSVPCENDFRRCRPSLSSTSSSRRCPPVRPCPPVFEDGSPGPCLPRPICQPNPRSVNSKCQSFPLVDAPQFSLCEDIHTLPMRWGTDVRALATCENGIFLGVFAGAAVILRNNVDNQVAQDVQQHGPYWGNLSNVISNAGDSFTFQIPLIAGVYAAGLYYQDEDLHELGLTMFAAFKFSVISSLALQYATGTHRSEGGTLNSFSDSGFPSTPVATSFALAAVIDERFGWKGGVPAYLAAGLIGWSEIDQNQHRVSDVVFGAALGYVIGKSLGSLHYRPDSPCKLVPFIDARSGTQGIGFERRY